MIRVYEVSPRDGLQNEPGVVPTAAKVGLIDRLAAAGVADIEVTSFVRPGWIPQLSDAAEVCGSLPRRDGVRAWGLVPNMVGLERAAEGGVHGVATFLSASETHNKKNVNRTTRESLAGVTEVIAAARAAGLGVRAYVSTAFGCPYEGAVAVEAVVRLATALAEAGAPEIALGDTTGMGNPALVEEVVGALSRAGIGPERIAVHFHDTRGTALANALAAYQVGVRAFDGSVGGIGGCPYAPGAAGNLATEDLVAMFHGMGVATGIDLDALVAAGNFAEEVLGRELPGRYHRFARGAEARSAAARARARRNAGAKSA